MLRKATLYSQRRFNQNPALARWGSGATLRILRLLCYESPVASTRMHFAIRQATGCDSDSISSVLKEAAEWLSQRGMPMWRAGELEPASIAQAVEAGEFFVLQSGDEVAGTVKFQLEDPLFWPDVPAGESAFIHRVAVRRAFAGGGASGLMMQWAADRARELGKRFVRLDCEAARPSLRAVYERFGFRYHSDKQVGPYLVARYELPLV